MPLLAGSFEIFAEAAVLATFEAVQLSAAWTGGIWGGDFASKPVDIPTPRLRGLRCGSLSFLRLFFAPVVYSWSSKELVFELF